MLGYWRTVCSALEGGLTQRSTVKGVPVGWILFGEMETQVLVGKQSDGSAGVGAGLCLLGPVSDHCLFPLCLGVLQREVGTSQFLRLFCR